MIKDEDSRQQSLLFPETESTGGQASASAAGKITRRDSPQRPQPNNRKTAGTLRQRPLQMALRIKLEELQTQSQRSLVLGIGFVIAIGIMAFYSLNSYISSNADMEKSYAEINELLTAAYRDDPVAHAEVVEQLPELTQGRLPSSLRQLQQRPIVAGENQAVAQPEAAPGEVPAPIEVPAPVEIPEPPRLTVYSDQNSSPLLSRTITDPAQVLSSQSDGEWVSLNLRSAPDMWLSQRYAKTLGDNMLVVTGTRVGLRSQPVQAQEIIVALVSEPEVLTHYGRQDGWYHVSAPAGFLFQVRVDAWENWQRALRERKEAIVEAERRAQLIAMAEQVTGTGRSPSDGQGVPSSRFDPDYNSSIILTEDSVTVPMITLYLEKSQNSIVLGRIQDDADIISIRRQGEWSRIMLSTGIPAWINVDSIRVLDDSLIKVVTAEAQLKIRPEFGEQYTIGKVKKNANLQVLERYPGWYQVNTPADFRVWVKTSELDRVLE